MFMVCGRKTTMRIITWVRYIVSLFGLINEYSVKPLVIWFIEKGKDDLHNKNNSNIKREME